MSIRNKIKKILKKKTKNCIRMGLHVVSCEECRKDSIAHMIRNHFDPQYIDNMLLIKYDRKNNKVLVSKKQFRYLLSLVNVAEVLGTYDFEFIEEIKQEDL